MPRIFLSGGGNASDTTLLDKEFASRLVDEGALVYLPVAMRESRYGKCLEWFKSVFEPLWQGEIQLLTDLRKRRGLSEVGGIYMGGGDTSKLLHDIDSADFGTYLRQATKQNIPIYGGSAGAIVLGKSIETAPEVKNKQDELTEGLDMLHGYSVVCHHNSTDYADATRLSRDLDQPLIVLSEQSGVLLENGDITSIGTRPVVLVTKTGEITKIELKEKRSLTRR